MQICAWRGRCFLGHDGNYLETCSQIYKLGAGWETHLNVFAPQERSKNDNWWPCHMISILFGSRSGVETGASDPKSHSGRYRDRTEIAFKHGSNSANLYHSRKQNLTKNKDVTQMSLIFPRTQLRNIGFNHLLLSETLNRPRQQSLIYFPWEPW